jgi:predicted DNA repair protein MutK
MAGSSLLLLIDDIASILDDVSLLSKVALKKTAGVVGDDLALNAQQIVGVDVNRELPVVWAVAKGSIVNKAILVPVALLISAFLPWAVTPLLMVGGAYLCYEGFEKLLHKWMHGKAEKAEHHREQVAALGSTEVDPLAVEKRKIRGAIRTDFILSAEIIVIALGTVATQPFATRLAVLTTIALLMTVGVYGLVAAIIKLDDAGMYLSLRAGDGPARRLQRWLGRAILAAAPYLMRTLSIAGAAAMFMVGGGILTHGIPVAHHAVESLAHRAGSLPWGGGFAEFLTVALLNGLAGILAGAVIVTAATAVGRLAGKRHGMAAHP